MTSQLLKPVNEVAAKDLETALERGEPFVVRNWLAGGGSLDSPYWSRHVGDVTVFPAEESTIASASYVLRESGKTRRMSFRELFDCILGTAEPKQPPVTMNNERYYMFGGDVPPELLEACPWPNNLRFQGSSPYVASEGVTAKAHFDHWFVFLMQLHGAKSVKLFPPEAYRNLYVHIGRSPNNPRRALVDLVEPDLAQFPRLAHLSGKAVSLEAGDLLYMPIGWWHEVTTDGFSVSINRRVKRPAAEWASALVGLANEVMYCSVLHDIAIDMTEVSGLATLARKEWLPESMGSAREEWFDFVELAADNLERQKKIPPGVAAIVIDWMQGNPIPSPHSLRCLYGI